MSCHDASAAPSRRAATAQLAPSIRRWAAMSVCCGVHAISAKPRSVSRRSSTLYESEMPGRGGRTVSPNPNPGPRAGQGAIKATFGPAEVYCQVTRHRTTLPTVGLPTSHPDRAEGVCDPHRRRRAHANDMLRPGVRCPALDRGDIVVSGGSSRERGARLGAAHVASELT